MNQFQNPFLNSYGMYPQFMPQQQMQQPVPQMQVTKVNGENGARSFQMGVNSSALLLDESGEVVWLVTSDGAGYKTVAPYDITPHQQKPTQEYKSLEDRVKRLESMIGGKNNANANDSSAVKPKQNTPNGREG